MYLTKKTNIYKKSAKFTRQHVLQRAPASHSRKRHLRGGGRDSGSRVPRRLLETHANVCGINHVCRRDNKKVDFIFFLNPCQKTFLFGELCFVWAFILNKLGEITLVKVRDRATILLKLSNYRAGTRSSRSEKINKVEHGIVLSMVWCHGSNAQAQNKLQISIFFGLLFLIRMIVNIAEQIHHFARSNVFST